MHLQSRATNGVAQETYTRHNFESNISAEEIFEMFFNGHIRRQNVNVRQRTAFVPRENNDNLSSLVLVFILILVGVLSSSMVSEPTYSLQKSAKFSTPRTTANLNTKYYVTETFEKSYTGSLKRLESKIDEDYLNQLSHACFIEQREKETLLWKARMSGSAKLLRKAHLQKLPSCDQLEKAYER